MRNTIILEWVDNYESNLGFCQSIGGIDCEMAYRNNGTIS